MCHKEWKMGDVVWRLVWAAWRRLWKEDEITSVDAQHTGQSGLLITPAKGSTLEGPVKAGGCSLVAGWYFLDACYYLLDVSW